MTVIPKIDIELDVNGAKHRATLEPRTTLADCLRHSFGLTGTHLGCEHGVCGACTVLVDGESSRSCLMLAVQAQGLAIRTVEGIAGTGPLTALQESFWDLHGLQCGYCTSGILMSLTELLAANADPSESEVRETLSGHLCRCTGYHNIVAAAMEAAKRMRTAKAAA
ncbi:MAG: (2Fe-2S)-binding protein [Burkholderiales bacterium]